MKKWRNAINKRLKLTNYIRSSSSKIIYIYVKFSVKNINHWYINIRRGK